MNYSKLSYARNLLNEAETLIENRCINKDKDKDKTIKSTLEEVSAERQKVNAEIKEWLKTAPLSRAMKEQIISYYIDGNEFYDTNFHRNIKTLFGENKKYRPKN